MKKLLTLGVLSKGVPAPNFEELYKNLDKIKDLYKIQMMLRVGGLAEKSSILRAFSPFCYIKKGCNNMDIQKILEQRHSVRKYTNKEIDKEFVDELNRDIEQYNKIGGLHIQFITNEPNAFGKSFLADFGKFKNVNNYIVMIGRKCDNLDEKIGYFGEKLVIKAQSLGLNTCWVGGTYSKKNTEYDIEEDEKLVCIIAIGYGETNGKTRKLKSISSVASSDVEMPDWFLNGVRFALLAPTALNQQRYKITLKDNKVEIVSKMGFYTKVDLGIIKYHFELGAGKEHYVFKF